MGKQQFLSEIGARLHRLPPDDIEKSLEYYSEMIDDRMEDGLSEEEAVDAMGSVDEIVTQILKEIPLPKLVKARLKPTRALRAWEIVLLVLGSPVWLPLLLTAAALLVVLYLLEWSFLLVLYCFDLTLAAGTVGGITGLFMLLLAGRPAPAVLFLGGGLIFAGLAILLLFVCIQSTRGVIRLGRKTALGLKSWFIGKERAQ